MVENAMVEIIYDEGDHSIQELRKHLSFKTDEKSVQEILDHFLHGRLNLSPAFQRKSVWKTLQREKLIKSIYENVPIPSIFLYEREENGNTVYDVIDGKQRLESIFMFIGAKGFMKRAFSFRAEWEEEGCLQKQALSWRDLYPKEKAELLSYPLQTITVSGPPSDIASVFVRINSTGSKLKPQEVRNAQYLKSPFLETCLELAGKKHVKGFLLNQGILSKTQMSRLKDVELVSELILSIHHSGPINRKKSIDEAMSGNTVCGPHLDKLVRTFRDTLITMARIFPHLRGTRFTKLADFYTLFMLVWKWRYVCRNVLNDHQRNHLAQAYLSAFGCNVDRVREKQKRFNPPEQGERLFQDYLITVSAATDNINQRQRRERQLESVLGGCFEEKDPMRTFNDEQRRVIWYTSNQKCSCCHRKLAFSSFHVHHIRPHSKGGRTRLENALLLCPKCHQKKHAKETSPV